MENWMHSYTASLLLILTALGCDERGGDVVGLPLADACGFSTPPPIPSATQFVNGTTPSGPATRDYDVDDGVQYREIVEAVADFGDAVVAEGYNIPTPDLCSAYKGVALEGFGFVTVDRESPLCQEYRVYNDLCGLYVRGEDTYIGSPVVVDGGLSVDFMLLCGPDGEPMFNREIGMRVHTATPSLLVDGFAPPALDDYLCEPI